MVWRPHMRTTVFSWPQTLPQTLGLRKQAETQTGSPAVIKQVHHADDRKRIKFNYFHFQGKKSRIPKQALVVYPAKVIEMGRVPSCFFSRRKSSSSKVSSTQGKCHFFLLSITGLLDTKRPVVVLGYKIVPCFKP